MSTSEARMVEQVVNTARYPLSEPTSAAFQDVVSGIRKDLAADGCSVLTDFVRPGRLDDLRAEGERMAPRAYYDVETVNAYNIAVDSELPAEHPGSIPMQRGNAFVARDLIPSGAIIHQLYISDLFKRFLAQCFELPSLHELGDPLAGLVLNVVKPGMEHPWHFDTNEFAISMLTQQPDEGGVFEYCPNIRTSEAENFGDVRSVLDGSGDHLVKRLTLRPGDLQLFKGRYALHRVSEVGGDTSRHTAIFAYSERPGVIGSVARTRQLFGRVLPEHHEAEGRAVRVDELLD